MVGCHDFYRIQVIFLCKQLAVVRVSITTPVIVAAAFITIIRVDYILPVVTPAGYCIIAAGVPIRFPDGIPDLALQAVWRPVAVPNCVLIRVAYSDYLYLRHSQKW